MGGKVDAFVGYGIFFHWFPHVGGMYGWVMIRKSVPC